MELASALQRLGLHEAQTESLIQGESVAFALAGAAEGTIGVARLLAGPRLQVGIYTLTNVGRGLGDFLTFEARARAAANALGAGELELMGIEVTNARLRAVLERGGFTPATMPVPEELGGGTFAVLSRVELLKDVKK